jgi:anti-anti-sigma factor
VKSFEVQQSERSGFAVLAPAGRLDTKTAPEFEKKVLELLKGGTRRFAVDFSPTEYVASAGLRVLVMLAKKMAGGEGRLVLCGMRDSVREVFEISGFTSLFAIVPTLDEAVAAGGGEIRSEKLAERAAGLLGGGRGTPSRPPVDPEVAGLAARAARALGAKVSEPPPAAAPPPPPPPKAEEKKGRWFRR